MTEEQGHFRQRKGSVKEHSLHGELKIAVQGKSMCFMRFIGDPLVKRGDPKGPPIAGMPGAAIHLLSKFP